MATVNEIISGIESKMEKSVAALRVDLASLRAGRATPSLLEKVMVDYYGSPTPVTQVAKRNRTGTAYDCYSTLGEKHSEGYRKSNYEI